MPAPAGIISILWDFVLWAITRELLRQLFSVIWFYCPLPPNFVHYFNTSDMDAYDDITLLDSIEMMNPELQHGKGKRAQAYRMIKATISPRITRHNMCSSSKKRRGRRNRKKLVKKTLKQSCFEKDRYPAQLKSPSIGYYKNYYFYRTSSSNNLTSIANNLWPLPQRLLPIDLSFKYPRFFEVRLLSNRQFVYQHHQTAITWTNEMKKALEFRLKHGYNINYGKQRGHLVSKVVMSGLRK